MIERDDIRRRDSRLDREQVREVVLEAWRRRPESERTLFVAKRFALDAAEAHPFECDRPRENVILSWIQPYIHRPRKKREPTALERWFDRPWFKRSHWPLRLIIIGALCFLVVQIFVGLATEDPVRIFGGFFPAVLLCVVLAMVWIDRRPGG